MCIISLEVLKTYFKETDWETEFHNLRVEECFDRLCEICNKDIGRHVPAEGNREGIREMNKRMV